MSEPRIKPPTASQWNDVLLSRRAELVEKKHRSSLTAAELAELAVLQKAFGKHQDSVAPFTPTDRKIIDCRFLSDAEFKAHAPCDKTQYRENERRFETVADSFRGDTNAAVYGLKGDGVSDDSPAIQRAVNAHAAIPDAPQETWRDRPPLL